MIKSKFSAVLTGVLLSLPLAAGAAYPVYQNYQGATMQPQQMGYMPSANGRMAQPQMVMQYQNGYNNAFVQQAQRGTNNMVMYPQYTNSVAAAQPTRITGSLPRVGSTQTVAGRQYYQPADYDRLADSGLYVGLSVAYNASMTGGMDADYTGEEDAYTVPGAFERADFISDTVIPLQVSVGAAINNDIRIDFSYLRYSGMSYPKTVNTSDGVGGMIEAQVDGGAITANTTMLNVYYNIDSFTGYLAGGSLRPYVGAGVGISLNTIADYAVYDNTFYSVMDPLYAGAGQLTGISDIVAYHNGGTTEELAFMLEGGVTTELQGGLKLDMFVRYANLGQIKNSGSIVLSQVEWLGDGAGGEYEAPYDSVFHYTNWYESGRLGLVDVGVRLRLQF
ncbi:MAG: hypothetical protein J6L47_01255 [Alphaproteobacteria bacterium]|nr:hypothetical protein [Alphaproteobacteria bacterium]